MSRCLADVSCRNGPAAEDIYVHQSALEGVAALSCGDHVSFFRPSHKHGMLNVGALFKERRCLEMHVPDHKRSSGCEEL